MSNFVSHRTGSLHCSQTLSRKQIGMDGRIYICMHFHGLVKEILSGSMDSQLWYEVDHSNDILQRKESNELPASPGEKGNSIVVKVGRSVPSKILTI